MPDDVIVVGAGPAGAIAAIVLARAGARVRVLDRAVFPRDKMCGDSLNPGAIRLLAARELPISRIARLVGFRTPSHFSTVFRRLTGTTPGAYRAALSQASQSRREGGLTTPAGAAALCNCLGFGSKNSAIVLGAVNA